MRQLSIDTYRRPLSNLELSRQQSRRAAQPFPGRWPTRVAWSVRNTSGETCYLGKPTASQAYKFYALSQNAQCQDAWLEEFDLGNRQIYRYSHGDIFNFNASLWTIYRPWIPVLSRGDYLTGRSYHHRLHGFSFYAPYRKLTPDRVREWLTQVRGNEISGVLPA